MKSCILILLLISSFSLFANQFHNYQLYYLDTNFKNFIGPIDFQVNNENFSTDWKIQKKRKKQTLFMIPSFCDSLTTLGTNRNKELKTVPKEILEKLNDYLNHGFTHIQSIGDSKWVKKTIEESKSLRPNIYYHTPILNFQESLKNQKTLTSYNIISSEEDLLKSLLNTKKSQIYLVHKYSEKNPFNLNLYHLSKIRKIAQQKKVLPIVMAYGDYFSVLETVNSGMPVLFHPIPLEVNQELSPNNVSKLIWAPSFNLFFLQTLDQNTKFSQLFDFSLKSPLLLKKSIKLKIELDENKQKEATQEYESYLNFFEKNQYLAEKMLIASGSGHINSFAGFSGWLELWILYSTLQDHSKIFQINQNTCQFINSDYDGVIYKNSHNNFILLSSNPLKNFKNIFDIHSVFKNSQMVYFKN